MLYAYSGAQPLINRMRVWTQWSPIVCAMAGAQAARLAAVGQDLRDLRNALSSRQTEASRNNHFGHG